MCNLNSHKAIFEKLEKLFLNRFNLDLKTVDERDFDKHLLGDEFGFAARDLVYIYQDIQKEFGISIPDEEVANEGLSSINKIEEMLVRLLNTSEKVGVSYV
jgi:acyl carrier protein